MRNNRFIYSLLFVISINNFIFSNSSEDIAMMNIVCALCNQYPQASLSTFALKSSYKIINDWGSGYQVEVQITNPSSEDTTSWSGQFNLATNSQQQITSYWNAVLTQSETKVTFTNPDWPGGGGEVIKAGQSTTFGFIVSNAQTGAHTLLNLQATANGDSPVVPVPASPTLNAITVNSNTPRNYTVSWNNVANAATYVLQQSTTSSFSNPTIVYQGSSTSMSFSNQANGTYYYRVAALNSSGTSPYSSVKNVTINVVTVPVPAAPTLNAITVNSATPSSYTVSWNSVTNASTYTLQQATNSSFSNATTVANGNVLSQKFVNQPNGTYYYRVLASNSSGNSSYSKTQSVTINVPTIKLDTPLLLLVNNVAGAKQYTINWRSVSNATSYKLEQSTTSNFASPKVIFTGNATSYKNTVSASGQYYYRVTALNGSSSSLSSNVQCTKVN